MAVYLRYVYFVFSYNNMRKIYGQVAGTCECGSEHSVYIKCGEFLDWLRNCQLLKKDSAAWSE